MPSVSLTMIVRDEESNLSDCLASCDGLFDEIVVVDTGSTDRTKEIAAAARDKSGRPARVFDFAWCNDFSAARNESIRRASGDWIFWMDADDRLDPPNRVRLAGMLAALSRPAIIQARVVSDCPLAGPVGRDVEHARLFPRGRCEFYGRVHEQLSTGGLPVLSSDVVIRHLGYESPVEVAAKLSRNLKLFRMELNDRPDDKILRKQIELSEWMLQIADRQESLLGGTIIA